PLQALPRPVSPRFPYTTLFRSELFHSIVHKERPGVKREARPLDERGDFCYTERKERKGGDVFVPDLICVPRQEQDGKPELPVISDRKSTRLNSSHVSISYAVFC